jgi:universal stress protein A
MKIKPTNKNGRVLMEVDKNEETLLSRPATSLVSFKRILVPIDFSDCSREALKCAVPFARQFGATLELVHVVASYYAFDPNGLNEYIEYEPQAVESGKRWLKELADEVVDSEVLVETSVRCGRPATEIVQAARETNADLIIISTHGYSGLKHALVGSTAENVVRHADCPVLTVRVQKKEIAKK